MPFIDKFEIRNSRSIELARCENVPPVMVITGPNGSGKSTLLAGVKQEWRSASPIYMGPHRAIRKQQIQNRFLGQKFNMADLMGSDQINRVEGLFLYDQARDPWNADESGNLIKYNLVQIASDINDLVASRYFDNGEIKPGEVPDVWAPLRDMISTLLPHLAFVRVDTRNRTNIQCLFKNVLTELEIDFDELSSGEKSIIQLFLPLIESEVNALSDQLRNQESSGTAIGIVADGEIKFRPVIIDEPELHLHPNLQETLLSYMREQASLRKFQFVIATHSQTIVEAATSEELFLLKPFDKASRGENQLQRIADNETKLSLLVDVFGRPSNLTAFRPLVFVEGRRLSPESYSSSDEKIYNLLDERFRSVTLIPCNSKAECVARAKDSRIALSHYTKFVSAMALVDCDIEEPSSVEASSVYNLPVSMVENLLVDSEVIWEAIRLVAEKTKLTSETVERELDAILDMMHEHEIDRRIKASLGPLFFRVKGPLSLYESAVSTHVEEIRAKYSPENMVRLRAVSTEQVDAIIQNASRREKFDGKFVLEEFYKKHLTNTGLSKEIFKYSCAEAASERKIVARTFDAFFSALRPETADLSSVASVA